MKLRRAGDRALQLLLFNEEFLVSVSHQLALITSLPFVHTARRYYRLNGLVSLWDWQLVPATVAGSRKLRQTWSFRGSKSRNKVSVGEPAEGSLVKIWAGHTDAKKVSLAAYTHYTSTNPCALSWRKASEKFFVASLGVFLRYKLEWLV